MFAFSLGHHPFVLCRRPRGMPKKELCTEEAVRLDAGREPPHVTPYGSPGQVGKSVTNQHTLVFMAGYFYELAVRCKPFRLGKRTQR